VDTLPGLLRAADYTAVIEAALSHLASKLITVLWHCITNHKRYDPHRLATDMHLPLQAMRLPPAPHRTPPTTTSRHHPEDLH
jgi:hypothetical protein